MVNHPNRSKFSLNVPTITAAQVASTRRKFGHTTEHAAGLVYRKAGLWEAWESGARPVDAALYELYVIKASGQHSIGQSIGWDFKKNPVGWDFGISNR